MGISSATCSTRPDDMERRACQLVFASSWGSFDRPSVVDPYGDSM